MLEPTQAHHLHKVLYGGARLLLTLAALQLQAVEDVVPDTPPRQQGRRLKDNGAIASRPFHLPTIETNAPAFKRNQAVDSIQERRFSAAARADDRDEFALLDLDVDVLDGNEVLAVARRDVLDADALGFQLGHGSPAILEARGRVRPRSPRMTNRSCD